MQVKNFFTIAKQSWYRTTDFFFFLVLMHFVESKFKRLMSLTPNAIRQKAKLSVAAGYHYRIHILVGTRIY